MNNLQIGDRIATPNGRTGTIAQAPFEMSVHEFIRFDDCTQFFILKSILKPLVRSNKRGLVKTGGGLDLDGSGDRPSVFSKSGLVP